MQSSTTLPRNAKRQHLSKARPKPQKLSVLFDRGFDLHRQGEIDQAQTIYEQVLAVQPGHFDAMHLLGVIAYENKQLDLSLNLINKALGINPHYASAHSNLGNTYKELNRVEEALLCFERAIELSPNFEIPHNNRGLVLKDMGRVDEAILSFDRAIALKPSYAEAHWNKSLALLLGGQLQQGWEMFEWRWRAEKTGLKARTFNAPLWLGEEDIAGKTLLIHPEQGLGDTIQFCRYAKLVKARGARVVMGVPQALIKLLTGLEGVDELVELEQALPHFDYHCPMMSLPLAFKTELDTIPSAQGYLRADPLKSQAWRDRLGHKTRPRVGLVWNGGFRADQPELWAANGRRNVDLSLLANSLQHLDVDFYSLQKGEPAESEIRGRELEYWPEGNFHNFVHEFKDFSDTAALIDNLDLVISVDTSTAHVAAALGKPTWILNRYDTCWRWMLKRNDSPWYESVKLYRQDSTRQWQTALQQVAIDLIQMSGLQPIKQQLIATASNKKLNLKRDVTELFDDGFALHKQGRLEQAKTLYEQVLAQQPKHFDALHMLGVIAFENKQFDESVSLITQALELDPKHASAYSNLGNALKELKLWEVALGCYDCALALSPSNFNAHSNRGLVLKDLRRHEEALDSFDAAIALKPDLSEAHSNRGLVLRDLNRVEEALFCFERAIELSPNFEIPHNNRGLVLKDMGRVDEAILSFDRAIALKPRYADAHWNKSLALLMDGQLRQGWELFEWRFKAEKTGLKAREFPVPLWLGEQDIAGKTLLLHPEQGLGDTIQFCRYAKLAQERGVRVLLVAPKPLYNLLLGLEGVDELFEVGQTLPHFDYHCPLMSLPLAFKTELHNIPSAQGYLRADPIKSEAWRQRLGHKTRPRVGLVWNGGFRADQPELWSTNARRNIELSLLAGELQDIEVDFYSLQKGEPAESEIKGRELELWPKGNFHNQAEEIKDFSDTAALIDNLDLVIAVDTSTAHLAAAMGKPTWILNRFDTCWRWLLERSDSPWYDSVKLYRQDSTRQWFPVLGNILKTLNNSRK